MVVVVGFLLGSLLAVSLIFIGAILFLPTQTEPQLPGSAALGPAAVFGKWGLIVGLFGMFFAFGGAAIENALSCAYNFAHFFGWPWGKFRPPAAASRFTLSWIVIFVIAMLIIISGVDPVSVVEYSIIFAVVILPLTYFPMLMAARDKELMGPHVNGWLANTLGWFYLIIITIVALCAIPLLIITHGGKG
jgi:manganese transport protein